jgi:hypothetical protein
MSVVEMGAARCPRCMAMAEYRFYEDDRQHVHYEVSCAPCGNVHSELCTLPLVDSSAA